MEYLFCLHSSRLSFKCGLQRTSHSLPPKKERVVPASKVIVLARVQSMWQFPMPPRGTIEDENGGQLVYARQYVNRASGGRMSLVLRARVAIGPRVSSGTVDCRSLTGMHAEESLCLA